MTALLDAARQALEALEWNYNTDLDNIPACVQWAKMLQENITALRQAIEQVEQQEPVAWIEHIAGGVEYNPYHKAALKLPEGMRFDLYTTPPQREPEPLSDDEIAELMMKAWGCASIAPRHAPAFARAIERAHGIGGEK